LGLDRGGVCRGVIFRIAAKKVDHELRVLLRREMLAGTYQARWVQVDVKGNKLQALTFVVDRHHERYEGKLTPTQAAHFIDTGKGAIGTTSDYFTLMLTTLDRLGIHDRAMERLRLAILEKEIINLNR